MSIAEFIRKNKKDKDTLMKMHRVYRLLLERGLVEEATRIKVQIVNGLLALVLHVATKKANDLFPVEDLFQEAYLHAMEMVERFNPEKAQITTYTYQLLTWRLNEYINDSYLPLKIPYTAREKARRDKKKGKYDPKNEVAYAREFFDDLQFNPVDMVEPETNPALAFQETPEENLINKEESNITKQVRQRLQEILTHEELLILEQYMENGKRKIKNLAGILRKIKKDPFLKNIWGEYYED